MNDWIVPDWPAPVNVRALSTTRRGGVSAPPYDDLNLADHVGDDPRAVAVNRDRLAHKAGLPATPVWLRQVHGTGIVDAARSPVRPEADGAWTDRPGVVCAVLTADCLPVLLCDRAGTRAAAVHAGWRGLAAGILETALGALGAPRDQVLAWLGPAIGPDVFEVGEEVRECFLRRDPALEAAFRPSDSGRWLADLYAIAARDLARCGVRRVFGGGCCTFSEPERFFSYRRDGVTGRMATLIWLDEDTGGTEGRRRRAKG